MSTYSYDEVFAAAVEYFGGDEIAANVWVSKYALRDAEGNYIEKTPADMHKRLAIEFARIESNYSNSLDCEKIYAYFDRFKKIVPQGSPMAAIGDSHRVQSLSNCFVIDSPHDSYGGIIFTDQEQAQIMKRRGGVGFDISTIRPRGYPTQNAANTSDGVGIFMERFSNTCREVAQGGRRGALMLTISCHHPDIRTFITIKEDLTKVTGANISVRITDEFMRAVNDGTDVQLRWPVDSDDPKIVEYTDARKLWDEIVTAARNSSEPGLLFWDNARRFTPTEAYADLGFGCTSTNPCGEIILSPYDSCRLMVINLTGFVDKPYTDDAKFDWDEFKSTVRVAQRLMDDLVDLEIEAIDRIIKKIENDPEPEHVKLVEIQLWQKIRKRAVEGRRTGLGLTGVGDCVAMLGMRYGDDDSIEFVGDVYKALALNSYMASIDMAKERGSFPIWSFERDMTNEFLRRIYDELSDEYKALWQKFGRRNIANTTTAPCGSISVCTQTTSGIEPAIFLKYTRRRKVNPDDPGVRVDFVDKLGDAWMHFNVAHHGLVKWLEINKSAEFARKWIEASDEAGIEESPYWRATAMDIEWTRKVKLQSAAQKWVCHAISNTLNLPEDVTVETVKELYTLAYELGCKGITVYRDKSREGVLIRDDDNDDVKFVEHNAPKRPEILECHIHRAKIKGEEWTIFVGLMDGRPYEVFGGLSEFIEIPRKYTTGKIVKRSLKQGAKYDLIYGDDDDPNKIKDIVKVFDNPNYSAFTRLISLTLRHGAPIQYVVEQLQKDKDADLSSFSRVMARTLKKYIFDGTRAGFSCTMCGSDDSLIYIEGCITCKACGHAMCG